MLMLASVVTDAADKIGFNSPSETTQRSADTYWCKLDECSDIKKKQLGSIVGLSKSGSGWNERELWPRLPHIPHLKVYLKHRLCFKRC